LLIAAQGLVLDGPKGVAYLKPRKGYRHSWKYNRLGAVFVPKDLQSDALAAHVVENGPAWRRGLRPGDELVRLGSLDVTKWRTDPRILPLSRFFEMPAGTKLRLKLVREGKPLELEVTLEAIFPAAEPGGPDSDK